jgi:Activator of Hsp90 ATPase homolog 1-like protein
MTARYLASTRAVIRKRFAAPRERVFQMWTEAEHLRRWFFPRSCRAGHAACAGGSACGRALLHHQICPGWDGYGHGWRHVPCGAAAAEK